MVGAVAVVGTRSLWMASFWTATCLGVLGAGFITLFLHWYYAIGPGFSAIAMLMGALMARKVARKVGTGATFIKATSTTRVIAFSWLLVSAIILGGGLTGGVLSLGVFRSAGWLVGAFGPQMNALIGIATLLAVVGPGYSDYRAAIEERGPD